MCRQSAFRIDFIKGDINIPGIYTVNNETLSDGLIESL